MIRPSRSIDSTSGQVKGESDDERCGQRVQSANLQQ